MKKFLSILTLFIFVLTNLSFAENGDELFGDLLNDNQNQQNQQPTQQNNQQNEEENLFWWWDEKQNQQPTTNQPTQQPQTTINTQTQPTNQLQLKILKYYLSGEDLIFQVDYLKEKPNFIVDFWILQNDVNVNKISIFSLSWKEIKLWWLWDKISLLIVGQDIKKITLNEINKRKEIQLKKWEKIYLLGELNDVDKQVLEALLNWENIFEIYIKWNNVESLIPKKEGVLKNNVTLQIQYIYQYTKWEKKENDKILKEIKKKETWIETNIIVLLILLIALSVYYFKFQKD
jgi:hypothetical protein